MEKISNAKWNLKVKVLLTGFLVLGLKQELHFSRRPTGNRRENTYPGVGLQVSVSFLPCFLMVSMV